MEKPSRKEAPLTGPAVILQFLRFLARNADKVPRRRTLQPCVWQELHKEQVRQHIAFPHLRESMGAIYRRAFVQSINLLLEKRFTVA